MNLPENHHPDDRKWIEEQLQLLSATMRQKAIDGYSEAYKTAYNSAKCDIKRDNKARHEANTRLRLFVQRYHKASLGHTITPPISR